MQRLREGESTVDVIWYVISNGGDPYCHVAKSQDKSIPLVFNDHHLQFSPSLTGNYCIQKYYNER